VEKAEQLGMKNRTGMQMSPRHGRALLETLHDMGGIPTPTPSDDTTAAEQLRAGYIEEADALGEIPVPGTLKGVAKSAGKMLKGEHPQVFVDKLAERMAYERGGTRLYDGALTKFRAAARIGGDGNATDAITLQRLEEIREQEAEHFALLNDCLEELGCDPTASTPGADLVGVQTIGLLQAMTDPRTSPTQCLNVLLAAELIDVAAWELLIDLAGQLGHDEMAQRFQVAFEQEQTHLDSVREAYAKLTAESAGVRGAMH
jgi:hypothetical protein